HDREANLARLIQAFFGVDDRGLAVNLLWYVHVALSRKCSRGDPAPGPRHRRHRGGLGDNGGRDLVAQRTHRESWRPDEHDGWVALLQLLWQPRILRCVPPIVRIEVSGLRRVIQQQKLSKPIFCNGGTRERAAPEGNCRGRWRGRSYLHSGPLGDINDEVDVRVVVIIGAARSSGVAMTVNWMAFSLPNVSYAHFLTDRIAFTAAMPFVDSKTLVMTVFPPEDTTKSSTMLRAVTALAAPTVAGCSMVMVQGRHGKLAGTSERTNACPSVSSPAAARTGSGLSTAARHAKRAVRGRSEKCYGPTVSTGPPCVRTYRKTSCRPRRLRNPLPGEQLGILEPHAGETSKM
ncbi:MAG: hypothetical protein BJ554DRAFT_6601, partial [Olpidium bornovanus]